MARRLYSRFKQWCDEYFFLPHRDEPRGIGGLFFDDFNEGGFRALLCLYSQRRRRVYSRVPARFCSGARDGSTAVGSGQFQLYRRSRYVEFNLVYDRGTLFGLQSKGRIESVLVSLPPLVRWAYDWQQRAAGVGGGAALRDVSQVAGLGRLALPIGIGLGDFGFDCFAPLAQ